jgi:serine/threonine protein kinase
VVASAKSRRAAENAHRTAIAIAAVTKRVGKVTVYVSDSPALGYLLGEGSMGTKVYKGKHVEWGEVAVKRMLKALATSQTADKEVQLLLALAKAGGPGSDNVVKYRSLEKDAHHIYISMELCACSLHGAIEQYTGVVSPADRQRIAAEMAAGVAFLHRQEPCIVHSDLRPKVCVECSILIMQYQYHK